MQAAIKNTNTKKPPKQLIAFSTCDLVTNQLAGLNLADAAKQAAKLLLGHVLGQVVDNEVGLAVVVCWASLHGRRAAAAVGGRSVGCGASSTGAICHWSLHVTDDLEHSGEEKETGRGQERSHRQKGHSSAKLFLPYLAIWNP